MPQPSTLSIIKIACAYQTVARHQARSVNSQARATLSKVDYHALFMQRVSKPAGHHSIVEHGLMLSDDELGIRHDALGTL